jgi:hypothetical protein
MNMIVDITEEYIDITTSDGTPVVSWSKEEWVEDPSFVVPAIANAILLASTDPNNLIKLLSFKK